MSVFSRKPHATGLAAALALALITASIASAAPAAAEIVHSFKGSFNGHDAPGGPFAFVFSDAADDSGGPSGGDVYVGELNEGFEGVIDKFNSKGEYAGVQITGASTPQGTLELVSLSTLAAGGVAVDDSSSPNKGDLYVADTGHGVVDKFNEAGVYLCQITGSATPSPTECAGSAGSKTPAESMQPTGVAVDTNGTVYVADVAHNVIDRFSPAGAYVGQFADPHITEPRSSIAVDAGNLYVANASPFSAGVGVAAFSSGRFAGVLDANQPLTVTFDPADGHVYTGDLEPSPEIREYDPSRPVSQALLDTFGAGHVEKVAGLSAGPSGTIYAADLGEHAVEMFGPDVILPDVSAAATEDAKTSATLNGRIDPAGGGEVTGCRFEYGTSTAYGQVSTCSPTPPYSSPTDVNAPVSGLTEGVTYHFRLVAANSRGTDRGEDHVFGTPAIDNESATASTTSATVHATIDPSGVATTCEAQYVTEAAFQTAGYADASSAPCANEVGWEAGERSAAAMLTGLQLDTTYHYRFIASNGAGVATGEDHTFATFGFSTFSFGPVDQEGHAYAQAGGHPYELQDTFALNTSEINEFNEADANVKDIRTELPPGLIGNPNAVPMCAPFNVTHADCSGASQVGMLTIHTAREPEHTPVPIYNLVPPTGLAAQLGARFNNFATVHIDAYVRTGSDYGVTAEVLNNSAAESVTGVTVTLWGVPAEASHDPERACPAPEKVNEEPPCSSDAPSVPFLTNPTACLGAEMTTMSADSWQAPGSFVQASSGMPGFTGCERLSFTPQITVQPESSAAASPTGLHVDLHVPQNQNPNGLAEADLKDAVVTLPQGVTVNPSSAGGLQACSPAQIELHGPEPAQCPEASKIGSVEIDTPLIDHPLDGGVYVAQQGNHGTAQGENPFGSLLAIYIAVHDPETGVVVKLAGEMTADPQTGQLTTSFLNNPQLPFEDLKLDIFGGPRAPLATPPDCGTYTTSTSLTPWSAPESGPPATPSSTFAVSSGMGGGACPAGNLPFSPSLSAGSTDIQASAFTPFSMTMSREDGQQNLSVVQLHLPEGLLGKLAAVTPCPEPQASEGTCGPESEIGHTVASVGLGPDPYTITGGRVFLTASYKGATYGLSIAEPAKAGPFDLGSGPCDCVVVRAKIEVDPHTSALTVTSDPLPTMLQGIPVQLKQVNVTIDRPGFTFNPTNCSQLPITATITGEQGASTPASVPFEVANCATLPFKPAFAAFTQAKTSKEDGASLRVKVTQKSGEANIHKVDLELPRVLPSRNSTLNQACTEAQFNADPAGCPPGSVIGMATARTPVLQAPLTGPAYLVSHGGAAFPDVEYVLQADERGGEVEIVLDGKTQIKKGITYSHFETVPDAPISSFETDLPEGPHSIFSTENPGRTNLCAQKLVLPLTISGQNGAVVNQAPRIEVTGCRYALSVSSHSITNRTLTLHIVVPAAGKLTASGTGLKSTYKSTGGRETLVLTVKQKQDRTLSTTIKLSFKPKKGRKLAKSLTVTFKR